MQPTPAGNEKISEAELNKRIRQMCDDLRLYAFHVFSYRISGATPHPGSSAGFPDWIIAGPGGILLRECKSEHGRLSRAQIAWGKALRAAGGNYAIWRPDDLASGKILSELQELAVP